MILSSCTSTTEDTHTHKKNPGGGYRPSGHPGRH